jgi:hypothetical protein
MATEARTPGRGARCATCGAAVATGEGRYNWPDGSSFHVACLDGAEQGLDMRDVLRGLEQTARQIEAAVAGLLSFLHSAAAHSSEQHAEPTDRPPSAEAGQERIAPANGSGASPSAPLAQRLVALPGEPWGDPLRFSAL